MIEKFPLEFHLADQTKVEVYKEADDRYEFLLSRLNSEKHNFQLVSGRIEESYETRFDHLQEEAVAIFQRMLTE